MSRHCVEHAAGQLVSEGVDGGERLGKLWGEHRLPLPSLVVLVWMLICIGGGSCTGGGTPRLRVVALLLGYLLVLRRVRLTVGCRLMMVVIIILLGGISAGQTRVTPSRRTGVSVETSTRGLCFCCFYLHALIVVQVGTDGLSRKHGGYEGESRGEGAAG